MRRIILESPYQANSNDERIQFDTYLDRAINDAIWEHSDSPLAMHAYLPVVMNDQIPKNRIKGLEAGYSWMAGAEAIVLYTDYGISEGMQAAVDFATQHHPDLKVETRTIGENE